jgi:hypothetical protein
VPRGDHHRGRARELVTAGGGGNLADRDLARAVAHVHLYAIAGAADACRGALAVRLVGRGQQGPERVGHLARRRTLRRTVDVDDPRHQHHGHRGPHTRALAAVHMPRIPRANPLISQPDPSVF